MPDVNEVEAQRERVEELRRQSLLAEQEAAARAVASDDDVTMKNLKEEEARLLNKIAAAESVGVVPENGWPKPESSSEFVRPLGTLDEPAPEATPLYVPSAEDQEPEGSTVTTTSTPATSSTAAPTSTVVTTPPTGTPATTETI